MTAAKETHIEHDGGGAAGEVGAAEGVQLVGQELAAAQRLDDHVQAGQDRVRLGQEVAVAQQLVLGHGGERAEHLLVLGVRLDEAVQDLGGHVAVLASLVPSRADHGPVGGAQQAGVIRIAGGHRRRGRRGSHRGHNTASL